jgi:hypothetical protein
MNAKALTTRSTPSRLVSVREQSGSDLRAAIHSPNDPGATLKRTNAVLALYFDPDNNPATRAAVRQEFVAALAEYPDWAVQRGFDQWVKTGTRRPTPGEILILVGREVKPITDEIRRRESLQADMVSDRDAPTDEELAQRRAAARDVMQRVGYAKAERPGGPVKADVTPDDVAEMKAHLAARGLA